jgi:hypothetical protein
MAGASVLLIITAPVIANMRLHYMLIDGGTGLNVISYAAFKQLQILESKLTPSHPFSGVRPQPVFPLGSIALPSHSGPKRTFAQRTYSSMSRRLTSRSMPSLADRPYSTSWPFPTTSIWS